ncbi:molybdopterin molybdotransferase MoeA [Clostridium boliviensis]|uniref:Molybdopterin molybdenumtransferase n=1 Tax=Clostridium boliviensis TaxID=318465 RepID=A0ABU4GQY6_9CLOT|nr:gephyrin-like molybdotransferase Glp [Clostridium boliviensis]MDW2800035.1 molybdopterin molybdotransferase MoeA [Clostridium boliviensis]
MKLLKVDTIASARDKSVRVMQKKGIQTVYKKLLEAQGYILAGDIVSQEPVPAFNRSTVDGYAVRSGDTAGSSESLPVFLECVDEINMGCPAKKEIHAGECAYVPTGGMIPPGADAVVMIEYCEAFGGSNIAIYNPVSYGKNVVLAGEDIDQGEIVIKKGTRIRPQEIGAMASLGITEVLVFKPWEITIISTGDELVSPHITPSPGEVRDINSYSLYAQAQKHGLTVLNKVVQKDNEQQLKEAVMQAMQVSDVVVISGGSSKGKKDATNQIIDEAASEGSFIHGLALKPGKPTIVGYDENSCTLLTGLPGHPVAAMLVFELLVIWVWRHMTCQPADSSLFARITSNLAGAPGKMTCQLVKLIKQENGFYAEPIFGKSGLITTLTRADGYILIEENKEGLKKDEIVEVFYI